MENNNQIFTTERLLTTLIIFILLSGNIFFIVKWKTTDDFSQENYLLKTLMKADADMSEVSIISQKAESYYAEASYSYEDGLYKFVESNCRLARDYYSEESQGYKKIKAELISKEIEDKLINIYIESLDLLSDITNNMYEACEHFESAARYYDKYYNTNVAYDDTSYDMGTAEIDNMNEKIREHDKNVNEYNDKLEEYRIELSKRM